MSFDPYNHLLKIRESIETPTPKMGAYLRVHEFIPSHSPTFLGAWNVILKLHFWPALLQTFALVTNPKLRLRHILRNFWTIILTLRETDGLYNDYVIQWFASSSKILVNFIYIFQFFFILRFWMMELINIQMELFLKILNPKVFCSSISSSMF
jgi:hypothetical protein